jgi:hypothetical protein
MIGGYLALRMTADLAEMTIDIPTDRVTTETISDRVAAAEVAHEKLLAVASRVMSREAQHPKPVITTVVATVLVLGLAEVVETGTARHLYVAAIGHDPEVQMALTDMYPEEVSPQLQPQLRLQLKLPLYQKPAQKHASVMIVETASTTIAVLVSVMTVAIVLEAIGLENTTAGTVASPEEIGTTSLIATYLAAVVAARKLQRRRVETKAAAEKGSVEEMTAIGDGAQGAAQGAVAVTDGDEPRSVGRLYD